MGLIQATLEIIIKLFEFPREIATTVMIERDAKFDEDALALQIPS